jgi:hypothetical protein
MASISSTAPTSKSASSFSLALAIPKTHTTSPDLLVSTACTASRASTAPVALAVAEILMTTPTAEPHTISARPTVGLAIMRVQ